MNQKQRRSSDRLNARGLEVFSKTCPKTGEIIPPRPRAVDMPFQSRQRSIHELLAATSREHLVYDGDFDDDDLDIDLPPVSENPLLTESTPHTDDFIDSHGMTLAEAKKILQRNGLMPQEIETTQPATKAAESVVKTSKAKSAPPKLAPEPSLETSDSDPE